MSEAAFKNRVSDGPIEGFSGGWAIIPFPGGRAHFWQKVLLSMALIGRRGRGAMWESLCGQLRITHDGIVALGAGDFPNCKRCEKAKRAEGKKRHARREIARRKWTP